jgi:diguanylate cyclase
LELNILPDELIFAALIAKELAKKSPDIAAKLFTPIFDAQTGLIQKKEFETTYLDRAIRWANAKKLPVCYGIIDIDNFTGFNDTYGHLVGDKVIGMISSHLMKTIRFHRERRAEERDSIGRRTVYPVGQEPYLEIGRIGGGEEFGVIFYNMDLETSTGIMERVRKIIETSRLEHDGSELGVTISGGVTKYNPGESFSELSGRADRNMYNAKAQGKNRIVSDMTFDPTKTYTK